MKVINLSLNLILIKLYISIFSLIRLFDIIRSIAFRLVFKLFRIKKRGASIAYFSILEHNTMWTSSMKRKGF